MDSLKKFQQTHHIMKDIVSWIDNITQDIVDTDVKLKDTMLKLQILSFHLEHSELKEWVDKELNGYNDIEALPIYRKVDGVAYGKVMQDRGFGNFATNDNFKLPTEGITNMGIKEQLDTISIKSSVSELEHMLNDKGVYAESISTLYFPFINQQLANRWMVQTAWKPISKACIEKVLNSIKSNLLNFLLELNKKLGDNKNYTIMNKKKEVDELFSNTIGKISAKQINLSIGDKSMVAVNSGDSMSVVQGETKKQVGDEKLISELGQLVDLLEKNIEELSLNVDDKDDLINELQRIKTQSKREKPKTDIVNTALKTINGLLIGVTANSITPIIIEKIQHLMSML